jgi:hypothetical protein
MAGLAQRLPVRPVPEQPEVATVRNDVIHNVGRASAHTAERVCLKIFEAGFPPFAAIQASSGVRSAGVVPGIALLLRLTLALAKLAVRNDCTT